MTKSQTLLVQGISVNVMNNEYISLTDMLQAKDGEFFISDWLRNRNTLEFWEEVNNVNFNYGEFAIIRSNICFGKTKANSLSKKNLKYIGR